ncbi:MAG: hypothetical protein H6978_05480 [Gammaproteobacteria bacterium]|nr:hypothetical protein [Gammaproteobacteria bacterium]
MTTAVLDDDFASQFAFADARILRRALMASLVIHVILALYFGQRLLIDPEQFLVPELPPLSIELVRPASAPVTPAPQPDSTQAPVLEIAPEPAPAAVPEQAVTEPEPAPVTEAPPRTEPKPAPRSEAPPVRPNEREIVVDSGSPVEVPRINLDAMKHQIVGEYLLRESPEAFGIARGDLLGDSSGAVTPEVAALRAAIRKGSEFPSCWNSYSGLGILAAPMLLKDAVKGDGCRW